MCFNLSYIIPKIKIDHKFYKLFLNNLKPSKILNEFTKFEAKDFLEVILKIQKDESKDVKLN